MLINRFRLSYSLQDTILCSCALIRVMVNSLTNTHCILYDGSFRFVNRENETWNQMCEYLASILITQFFPRCCEELLKFSENWRAFHQRDLTVCLLRHLHRTRQDLMCCNLCNLKKNKNKKEKNNRNIWSHLYIYIINETIDCCKTLWKTI